MSGWLKIHRKLLDSQMYRSLNSKQRDVMYACLLSVNYTENEWEFNQTLYKCKPGQFITSLDSLRKKCGNDVKVQSVRTALLKLEKWGFLTNESTKTGRLITICKWETYQDEEKPINKPNNKEPTKSQQRPNKDLTPIEEVKKEKKEKNNKERILTRANRYPIATEILKSVRHLFDKKYFDTEDKKDKWVDEIDKLLRIEKEDKQTIIDVITFARNDEFWKANFLSVSTIRKKTNDVSKFDNMKAKFIKEKSIKKAPYETGSKNEIVTNFKTTWD